MNMSRPMGHGPRYCSWDSGELRQRLQAIYCVQDADCVPVNAAAGCGNLDHQVKRQEGGGEEITWGQGRNHLGAGENPNNPTYLSSFLPIPTSEPPILDDLSKIKILIHIQIFILHCYLQLILFKFFVVNLSEIVPHPNLSSFWMNVGTWNSQFPLLPVIV